MESKSSQKLARSSLWASVPNIDEGHNKFYYYENNNKYREKNIVIPTGAYEIEDIESYIKKHIVDGGGEGGDRVKDVFSLKPNLNTLKCGRYSSVHGINFQPKDSIAYVLGYSPSRVLEPRIYHQSDLPVKIVKVRTIHIDSNITVGAFYNDRPLHTIYEFSITDEAGCAINESSKNLIYLPVNQHLNYTERYHGLRYEKGYVDYSLLNEILSSHLADVDMVYVKGQCKRQFLIDRLNDMQIIKPNIINVEDCDSRLTTTTTKCEKIEKCIPLSLNHDGVYGICALNNCLKIKEWVYKCLPM
ncbi:unnamed protein product [Acanthoscelides obtectus]|uniref:Uncharacterized protein n=1 Tax=Acanthoscelides obtectus TaxID=200917 RepID=A0A9P0MB80_ACAOB|nr:unnamed protein product [Acanthoscelides obtectus]CAK1624345.1 hypothetical protein AOBTE_LOCUS2511 [Acanthoscelides obtectus]